MRRSRTFCVVNDMRFLRYDLKRIFSRRALVILLLISPVVIIFVFSTVAAPMIFTARGLHFKLAVCDEDGSEPVREFISQLVNSQALSDLVTVYPVPTPEAGEALVLNNDVSVLVHIPAGLFEDMRAGRQVEVSIYSTPVHALEAELITMTLESSLSAVGKSQNLLESAKSLLVQKGVSQTGAEAFLDDSISIAITEYMNRREVLGKSGTVSPMGEYMPLEYYLSAVFSLFAALAILPLIHYTAADANGAILRRGLISGQGSFRFFGIRILSGMILILLVQLMVVPASALLRLADSMMGGSYHANIGAMLAAMLLSSLCYSTLAIAVGTWFPNERTALWAGFFLVLIMAAAGGAIIPSGALPDWVDSAFRYLPLRASMRALSCALFDFNNDVFLQEAGRMGFITVVLLPAGFFGLHRRGRGA